MTPEAGDEWVLEPRRERRRAAFEYGVEYCLTDIDAWWPALAPLTKDERERVRNDVRHVVRVAGEARDRIA